MKRLVSRRWWLRFLPLGAAFVFVLILLWMHTPGLSAQSPDDNSSVASPDAFIEGNVQCDDVSYGSENLPNVEIDPTVLSTSELIYALDQPIYVAPPNTNGSTPVGLGLYVFEISDLNPDDSTFTMEGFLDMSWCDPRVKFDVTQTMADHEVYLEDDVAKKLERMWWPDVEFVNEVVPRRVENEELIIAPDGTVDYREKFSVQLAVDYDMHRYPFDVQTLVVEIESFAWSSDQMQFKVEQDIIDFSEEFSVPEWEIINIQETLENKQELRDRNPYSEFFAEITVQRDPGFYTTKIMIPLMIIVAISWAVFWMVGDGLADRMSVSFTGVLAAVAYQFIISESLPRHVYNTFLDALVLFSFVVMTLTIMENIIVNNLHLNDHEDTAMRIDKISRFIFPIGYVLGLALLVLVYLG